MAKFAEPQRMVGHIMSCPECAGKEMTYCRTDAKRSCAGESRVQMIFVCSNAHEFMIEFMFVNRHVYWNVVQ
jgi:hypothetical protein